MKTVTVEQFMTFNPCSKYDENTIKKIAGRKKRWSALDVLKLDFIPAQDRLWAVLREEFIDAPILHEFACRLAEGILKQIDNPDPRSVAAIEIKRKWLKGEATDEELTAARDAARAAARDAAWDAAGYAAGAAAGAAAWDAAWDAAGYAAAAWDAQIKMLIDLLT